MNALTIERRWTDAAPQIPFDAIWQDTGKRVPPWALWLLYCVGAIQVAGGWAAKAIIPQVGRRWIIDKIQNVAPNSNSLMEWIGWGTGATAESDSNTALATEAAEARVQGTLSQPTADTDRCVATLETASDQTITESGRFNQQTVSGSVMLFRMLFTGLPLVEDGGTGDRIEFTEDHLQEAP